MAPRIGYRDAWYRRLVLVGGRAIGANPDSEIEHVPPPVPPGLEPGRLTCLSEEGREFGWRAEGWSTPTRDPPSTSSATPGATGWQPRRARIARRRHAPVP